MTEASGSQKIPLRTSAGLLVFPLLIAGFLVGIRIARLARNANGSTFTETGQFRLWTAMVAALVAAAFVAFPYSTGILLRLRKQFPVAGMPVLVLAYLVVGVLTVAVGRAFGGPDTSAVADYGLPRTLFVLIGLVAVAPAIMGIWVIELALRELRKRLGPAPGTSTAPALRRLRARLNGVPGTSKAARDQEQAASITAEISQPPESSRAQILSDLLLLRTKLLALLLTVGSVIGIMVLAVGALRLAVLAAKTADGKTIEYPIDTVVVNGLFYSALLALFYIPAYLSLQDRAREYLNVVFPAPAEGYYDKNQYENRSNLESLLKVEATVQETLQTGIAIAAPLLGILVATLLPKPK
jgi:hypothetical protein